MKMKLALLGLGGLCALGISASDAAAQRGGPGGHDMAEVWDHLAAQYDKNKDGRITRDEYPRGEEKFAVWDSNGDGSITKADLESRGNPGSRGNRRNNPGNRGNPGNRANRDGRSPGGPDFLLGRLVARAADHDQDGRVTRKEWLAFVDRLDCDEDGTASAAELKLSHRRFEMVKAAMDTNRDGRVQVTELAALFARLDRDGSDELAGPELGTNPGRGGLRRNEGAVPRSGQVAPDFELPLAEQPKGAGQKVTIKLSSFAGKKPVALIFGSYT